MKRSLVLCVVLAGCASTGSTIPSPEDLARAVNGQFTGRPAQALAHRYGIPHEQDVFQGQRYLLWHTSRTIQWGRDVTTTTSGAIGSMNAWPWTTVPYVERTTARVADPQAYQCTMQVAVTEAGVVEAIGFLGKMGACQDFLP